MHGNSSLFFLTWQQLVLSMSCLDLRACQISLGKMGIHNAMQWKFDKIEYSMYGNGMIDPFGVLTNGVQLMREMLEEERWQAAFGARKSV